MIFLLGAAATCVAVTLLPAQSASMFGAFRVEWAPAEDHRGFIVAVRETVPNGQRVQSAQRALNEPGLMLVPSGAAALTKFEVTVTARCDGSATSAPVRTEILHDRRGRCLPPDSLTRKSLSDGLQVSWSPVQGATGYRIAALDLADGQTLWRDQSVRTDVMLPSLSRPALLQVQAVCGADLGAPSHALLAPID